MDPLIRIVTINLGSRSYCVHIGENLLDEAGRICREHCCSDMPQS